MPDVLEQPKRMGRPKTKDNVVLQVCIPKTLAATIRDRAATTGTTLGEVIESWHDKANLVDQTPNKA